MVQKVRRIASRMIAESLNLPKTVVIRILKEGLRKRKTNIRINTPKHMHTYPVLFFTYSPFFKHFQLYKQIMFTA